MMHTVRFSGEREVKFNLARLAMATVDRAIYGEKQHARENWNKPQVIADLKKQEAMCLAQQEAFSESACFDDAFREVLAQDDATLLTDLIYWSSNNDKQSIVDIFRKKAFTELPLPARQVAAGYFVQNLMNWADFFQAKAPMIMEKGLETQADSLDERLQRLQDSLFKLLRLPLE